MSSPDTRDHAVRAVSSSHSRSDDAIDDGVAGGRGGGECASSSSSSTSKDIAPSSRSSSNTKPKSGDVLTFTLHRLVPMTDAKLHDDDVLASLSDPPFDASGTHRLVLYGGNYLPGLHDALSTMRQGERASGIRIDAGYGNYDIDLVFIVCRMRA